MTENPSAQRSALDIRIEPEDRELIDEAARLSGKSEAEFVVESARQAARDTLADQSRIGVDAQTWRLFVDALDRPPAGEGFRRLMETRLPWNT